MEYQQEKSLVNAVFFLSIFCYLQLIPIQAEVQPYAVIPAIYLIWKYGSPIGKYLKWYFAGLFSALLVSLYLALSGSYELGATISTFAAIAAPVIIFGALIGRTHLISATIFRFVFWLWVGVGFSQKFLPAVQNALGIDTLFTLLISRYSAKDLSEWERGVTLLAPEPSYSARTIFLFAVFILWLYKTDRIKLPETFFYSAGLLFLCFVNQSGTVGFYALLFVIALNPLYVLVGGVAALTVGAGFTQIDNIRFVVLLVDAYDLIFNPAEEFDAILFMNKYGSTRLITSSVAYAALFIERYWGGGIGSWSTQWLDALPFIGMVPEDMTFFSESGGERGIINLKPAAHVALMVFDLGILGLAMELGLAFATIYWLKNSLNQTTLIVLKYSYTEIILAFTCVLWLLINCTISAPEFWVSIAILLDLCRHKIALAKLR